MNIYHLIFFSLFIILSNSADQGDWVNTFELDIGLFHPFYAGYLNVTRINITNPQALNHSIILIFPPNIIPTKTHQSQEYQQDPDVHHYIVHIILKDPSYLSKTVSNLESIHIIGINKQIYYLYKVIYQQYLGPSGVGFSPGNQTIYEDQRASMQFYFALLKFYQKFPELKDQTMYLSGQNYAGIMVPRMAETIINMNKDPDTPSWQKIKLGGFILNNPCIGGDECESHFQFTSYTMKFLKNHYFISDQQYEEYRTNCTLPTDQCQNVKKSIQSHFMNTGADFKNLYSECISQEGDMKCLDLKGILNFLNNPKNKLILNADPNITWQMCNFNIQQSWVRDEFGSIKIYEKLFKQQKELKIWIISGGLSAQIPITGTKHWFQQIKHNMGLKMVRMWQPWFYNHTINAGDIQELKEITLVTLRSAGYDLWNDQPEIGYHIIDSFLKGNSL